MMFSIFCIIVGLMAPLAIFGLVIIVQLFRTKAPVDASNIFNRLRILWFSITRMDQMVEKFPWLMKDEWENMEQ